MSTHAIFLDRNARIAETFEHGEMPALPSLNTMVLTCLDARVDPAHVLGVDLGEVVVFRNNGGRVTPGFIDELSALSAMVKRMTGAEQDPSFAVILMQHTNCGAQSLADPAFAAEIKTTLDVDVSATAITNQNTDLIADIDLLTAAEKIPGSITVSALLYDVQTGKASEVAAPKTLDELRT